MWIPGEIWWDVLCRADESLWAEPSEKESKKVRMRAGHGALVSFWLTNEGRGMICGHILVIVWGPQGSIPSYVSPLLKATREIKGLERTKDRSSVVGVTRKGKVISTPSSCPHYPSEESTIYKSTTWLFDSLTLSLIAHTQYTQLPA